MRKPPGEDHPPRQALFAVERSGVDGEPGVDLRHVRDLTVDEARSVARARLIFLGLTDRSAMAALKRAEDDFRSSITAAEASRDAASAPAESQVIQEAFRSWLTALRRFADGGASWASKTFGPEAKSEFERLLSVEYDCNFAYRLCYQLRNVSDHQDQVINDLTLSSSVAAPRSVMVRLNGPKAASCFTKMKAAVRAELLSCTATLDIPPMVAAVMASCERVHFRLMEAVWGEIEPLIRLCEGLHEEAQRAGGSNGWITDPEGWVPDSHIAVTSNPIGESQWLRELRSRYMRQEQRPWEFTASMFTKPFSSVPQA